MARRNNYRSQPEIKVIPIRETEFKIKAVEPRNREIKIIAENGTKCTLYFANYNSYDWELLQDYLSENDSVIVRHRASKIIDAYVEISKSYHILKDIKYDDQKAGYCFVFPEMDFFLSRDDFFIKDFFWGCLRDIERLKKEFLGKQAEIVWINKRAVKLECFLGKF